jgi:hypothetical protein
MEQWVDELSNSAHRITQCTSEIHALCDRLAGSIPTPEQGPEIAKVAAQGGLAEVQTRIDNVANSLALLEKSVSRLNSMGV